ncbi:Electron transport protein SCO1/SenC [Roseovarius sp. EC-HK134]|uniref:SCO family protein n=1 Tax=unclassified Roseovarius TaxID=2614913 RepID=UPI00125351EB|nr:MULTISPECIES: SCO family protein [unclassified Roseovarius]VVT10061.1 Electron transport protein SCO1/SenC [Roseovarius sp. EC-HK134]VVT10255.1 Electron transport protein SCO1/SenC [Roseovarius sp. EC-SD190]
MIRTALLTLFLAAAPALADGPATADFARERLAMPQVTLIDQYAREQAFHGPLTDGQMLVINFNYTTCESICPIGNDVMAELDDMLPTDAPVRLLSITIDPGRDTPAHMRKAADTFGASERWSWLTGTPGEVSRLLAAFDADFANIVLHDPVFIVGDLQSERFYRSQSIPEAQELADLVASLIR